MKAAKPRSIDAYLAAVSPDQRAALEMLRRAIKAAAPKAEECISYGLAAFRLDGHGLVAFGAAANHCSFFPMSSTTVKAHKDDLKAYDTSKGTIRFKADKPLPTSLVRKIVKTRIAESEQRKVSRRAIGGEAVNDFLRRLEDPRKPVLAALRKIIRHAAPNIREGIKWNAPSFRVDDYFATAGLHDKDVVRVVFHRGARPKGGAKAMRIADPAGLLEWHARDRCSAKFYNMKDVKAKAAELRNIVRQWIKQI